MTSVMPFFLIAARLAVPAEAKTSQAGQTVIKKMITIFFRDPTFSQQASVFLSEKVRSKKPRRLYT